VCTNIVQDWVMEIEISDCCYVNDRSLSDENNRNNLLNLANIDSIIIIYNSISPVSNILKINYSESVILICQLQ